MNSARLPLIPSLSRTPSWRELGACLALGAGMASVGWADEATAQPAEEAASSDAPVLTADQKAQAQQLFDRGKAAHEAANYAEACPLFAESQRIDPGLGTLLFLADCREQLGQTASAWAGFLEAAAIAKAKGQIPREKIARDRANAIEPKLSRLKVEMAPKNTKLGVAIKRNGVAVSQLSLGEWLPVDPGAQEISASANGYQTWTGSVDVAAGPSRAELLIPALLKAAAVPLPPPPDEELPLGDIMRISGLALAGSGVIVIGVGAAFGIDAIVSYDAARATCEGDDPTRCSTRGVRLQREASSSALVSTITFSVGAAALAGGALLFFLAVDDAPPASVGVAMDSDGGFLSIGGAW